LGWSACPALLVFFSFLLSQPLPAQRPESLPGAIPSVTDLERAHAGEIWIRAARLFDGRGDQAAGKTLVRVKGRRIEEVVPDDPRFVPPGVKVVQVADATLLPGLIDLHTHLLLHPYDETSWDDQVLKESLEARTIRAVVQARATVRAGFTTIRDLGTEGAGFADVALRDSIRSGTIEGPRIFAVTRAIVASGCYGPFGDPRHETPKGAEEATGVDGVRKAVRGQLAAGADWIKLYADYHRGDGRPTTATFTVDEIAGAVQEAATAGVPVAAHATIPEGIQRALDGGVRTIEHGTGATSEQLARMRDKKVVLCPTLAASEAMALYGGWRPGREPHRRIVEAREMFRRALDSGVTIANGSDAGVFAHGTNVREIELMVEYGMTPAAALRAATSVAAAVLAREKDLGTVEAGRLADLLLVRGNPLEDVRALRNVLFVMKDGRVVREP
jgi:imidazolonepropionase-like amidohydrolase